MPWQDMLISAVNFTFGLSLLPQLYGHLTDGKAMNLYSTLHTAVGMYIIAGAFYTMDYYFSLFTSLMTATVWLLLFFTSLVNKESVF